MIASRPTQPSVLASDDPTLTHGLPRSDPPFAVKLISATLRLALLAAAGLLMQAGWIAMWTLSYRLTHGNDFTFTYLMTQPAVWNKLMDLLLLANTLVPGLEMPGFQGPASLDVVVNSLVMAFILTGLGYLAAVI